MIIKRKIQEYREESLDDQIKSIEKILKDLEKDLEKVKSHKSDYDSEKSYKLDIKCVEEEIESYKAELLYLRAKKNVL